jgi:hypothetical protein
MFLAETDSNANHSVDDTRCECDATNGDTTIAVGTEDRFRVDRRKLERLLQGIVTSIFRNHSVFLIMQICVFNEE